MSEPFVTIDLHGMKQNQAMRVIDRALVHGYHGGDSLKTMIGYEYRKHPMVKRIQQGDNPGITVLVLKELFH